MQFNVMPRKNHNRRSQCTYKWCAMQQFRQLGINLYQNWTFNISTYIHKIQITACQIELNTRAPSSKLKALTLCFFHWCPIIIKTTEILISNPERNNKKLAISFYHWLPKGFKLVYPVLMKWIMHNSVQIVISPLPLIIQELHCIVLKNSNWWDLIIHLTLQQLGHRKQSIPGKIHKPFSTWLNLQTCKSSVQCWSFAHEWH